MIPKDRSEIVAVVRSRFESGATATELLLCIQEQMSRPLRESEFEVLMILRAALGVGLGDAKMHLASPLFGHAPHHTTESFDAMVALLLPNARR